MSDTPKEKIGYDDFVKTDIRIGTIKNAERIADTDKLLKLSVDLGEATPRQIVSGIAEYFPEPSELIGVQCAFAANLEPRVIRGEESDGMILAVGGETFSLLSPRKPVPPGSSVV